MKPSALAGRGFLPESSLFMPDGTAALGPCCAHVCFWTLHLLWSTPPHPLPRGLLESSAQHPLLDSSLGAAIILVRFCLPNGLWISYDRDHVLFLRGQDPSSARHLGGDW